MKHRNQELDRLRAFAVIMTVLIHYARVFFPWSISPEYHQGTSILNIWENSWTGVDLFLVISGYIICRSIVTKIDSLKNSSLGLAHYIKIFYLKRIYRIYPVAWFVFFVVLLCSFIFNDSQSFGVPENTIEAGISMFTYTFNYYFGFHFYKAFTLSPYWSLSVEEQFYLLLPLFLVVTNNNRQRVTLLLGALFLITFYIRPCATEDNIFFTQQRCDGLIYGCLIYFLMQQEWINKIIENNPGNKYFRIVVTFILVLILASVTALGFSNSVVIPLACIISSLLVILAALEKNIIISFSFIQPTLDYLGSRSYSLYLVHFPMFSLTQEIMFRLSKHFAFSINSTHSLSYTLIALLLTLTCTEVVFRYIERPFIQKGKQLAKNSSLYISNLTKDVKYANA